MNLLVANFDCQDIIRPNQVVEAVKLLPIKHVNGIQVIRYDPTRAIATTLSYMGTQAPIVSSQGLFFHDRETSVIVLFQFDTAASFYHVLYHEIGHYVFLKCLDQRKRDLWMYGVRSLERTYVSSYARQNSREDFAESYAFYCTQKKGLLECPLRYAFLANHVFAAA